jgi:hypothetical protein
MRFREAMEWVVSGFEFAGVATATVAAAQQTGQGDRGCEQRQVFHATSSGGARRCRIG